MDDKIKKFINVAKQKDLVLQTVVLKKSEFRTKIKAQRWAKDNAMKYSKIDETSSTFRLIQRDYEDFERTSFKSEKVSASLTFVFACLKGSKEKVDKFFWERAFK